MARIAWQFHDPTTATTYSLPVNPNDASISFEKNLVQQATTAPYPEGKTVIQEGARNPRRMQFSGVLLTEAQYNAMITWFNKSHQIKVTDDLGQEFWVLFTSFSPQRVPTRNHPWRHDWDAEVLVVET